MNTQRDPDRLIHAFLMEGATELADDVYAAVRDRIEHKRQRAVIGSWREPDVNRFLKLALAIAAVVVVAVGGYRQFGGANVAGPGSSGSPSPTTSPSASPSDPGSTPPLTETFTSDRYGIKIKYPNGWVTKPATEPWTTGIPDYASSTGDVMYDPVREGDLWIAVASQPIGATNPDAWAAETIAFDDGCTATEPITVDGATGLVGTGDCARSAVTTDGRGYFIWLYTSGDATSIDVYDRTWFEEVLATVQLQPADAVDAGSGTVPSPSEAGSAPPLTETFTSDRHGIAIKYPSGWVTKPATEPWTTGVPDFASTTGDVMYEPVREGNLWIAVASQPIGDAAPDAWAAKTIAFDDGCTTTDPFVVDGAAGLIGTGDCTRSAVTTDGRGYFIWLYTSGDDSSLDSYDRTWFEEVLATIQLQPGKAVDGAPSASP